MDQHNIDTDTDADEPLAGMPAVFNSLPGAGLFHLNLTDDEWNAMAEGEIQ